jgi:ABC-type glycerol-3-phosphate transport system permease component
MIESRRGKVLRASMVGIGVAFFLLWSLFPIFWILSTSLKTDAEIYGVPPVLWPTAPTFRNFDAILFKSAFPQFIKNSFVVAGAVTLLSMVVAALAAYPIARMRFAGRNGIARGIVVSYLLPPALLFIPLFVILQRLGLVDTRTGLVVAYISFTVPFCTWMLIGYLRSIPMELDEAARIDGATRLQTLTRVLLPIALPGLSVVALFAFTHAWNEFLYALVFVYSNASKTFTAGLTGLIMGDVFVWGQLMAASIVAIVPILIIYIVAQRYLVEGLAAGSIKQ